MLDLLILYTSFMIVLFIHCGCRWIASPLTQRWGLGSVNLLSSFYTVKLWVVFRKRLRAIDRLFFPILLWLLNWPLFGNYHLIPRLDTFLIMDDRFLVFDLNAFIWKGFLLSAYFIQFLGVSLIKNQFILFFLFDLIHLGNYFIFYSLTQNLVQILRA